ncbi:hypothetical protein M407DRAFT_245757 [Tulasnella calospora MUT 4182]|uniref:Uncharacterized protein n=1 Tax=Tulasnella calospora MUT 4182 TaxID=1051891 RepID=A0A0C3Q2W0_9AGAM|nr:hypothetical protein M407DRAFT_246810 [Tulasnella calospora MUT 4182]KIO20596.1 hypothetical protein M407DRAFT_245757 [Tulasnella calospora MUT 4182]
MSGWYHVASRKFCCCLPVRIGVFVLSALSAFFGGISAFVVWYTVVRTAKYGTVDSNLSSLNNNGTISDLNNSQDWQSALNSVALDKQQYYAFIVIGVILSIYTLFSVFGFIGSIFRKRALVALYSTVLWFLLGANLGIAIYMSYSAIKRRDDLAAQCAADSKNNQDNLIADGQNKITTAACDAASKIGIAVYIIVAVVQLLIQLYCCIIVKRYVEQLSEEQGFKAHVAGNRVAKDQGAYGSYYPHQPLTNQHELGPYPYAQPDHSFGAKV